MSFLTSRCSRTVLAPGQRHANCRCNIETMGIVSYEHTFSSDIVADFRGMVRDNANDFSTPTPTPRRFIVSQHNWFSEGYFKGNVTINHGHHEWKAGVESDNTFLNENFSYIIRHPMIDPIRSRHAAHLCISRESSRPRAICVRAGSDSLGNWTMNAGLRWDHYQLLLNRQALEPRFSISRYFPSAGLVLHFSYDRVFQTPSFENILLSSSTAVESLIPEIFCGLPVQPSVGKLLRSGPDQSLSSERLNWT